MGKGGGRGGGSSRSAANNRSNQMNPNNAAYWSSRGTTSSGSGSFGGGGYAFGGYVTAEEPAHTGPTLSQLLDDPQVRQAILAQVIHPDDAKNPTRLRAYLKMTPEEFQALGRRVRRDGENGWWTAAGTIGEEMNRRIQEVLGQFQKPGR